MYFIENIRNTLRVLSLHNICRVQQMLNLMLNIRLRHCWHNYQSNTSHGHLTKSTHCNRFKKQHHHQKDLALGQPRCDTKYCVSASEHTKVIFIPLGRVERHHQSNHVMIICWNCWIYLENLQWDIYIETGYYCVTPMVKKLA